MREQVRGRAFIWVVVQWHSWATILAVIRDGISRLLGRLLPVALLIRGLMSGPGK